MEQGRGQLAWSNKNYFPAGEKGGRAPPGGERGNELHGDEIEGAQRGARDEAG